MSRPARSSRSLSVTFSAAFCRFSMSFSVSVTDLRRDAACSSALSDSRPFGSVSSFRRESFSRSPEKYGCRKA